MLFRSDTCYNACKRETSGGAETLSLQASAQPESLLHDDAPEAKPDFSDTLRKTIKAAENGKKRRIPEGEALSLQDESGRPLKRLTKKAAKFKGVAYKTKNKTAGNSEKTAKRSYNDDKRASKRNR